MKALKIALCAAAAVLSISVTAQPVFVAGDQSAETQICLAAVTNDLAKYKNKVEGYSSAHLMKAVDHRTFANKLKCNNQNVAKFARQFGAKDTATFITRYLQQSVMVKHDIASADSLNAAQVIVVTASTH